MRASGAPAFGLETFFCTAAQEGDVPSENRGLAELQREMECRATDAQREFVGQSNSGKELCREGAPEICLGSY